MSPLPGSAGGNRNLATHAVLDPESRRNKARKMIALIEPLMPLAGAHVLDIGTGTGEIARGLADAVGPEGRVSAVDTVDQLDRDDPRLAFRRLDGTALPYPDRTFDLVVSNHVVEHVGERDAQVSHFREIRRVLKDSGLCYMAVPNLYTVKEPHYGLHFLSWLPASLADAYMRRAGKGPRYYCRLLSRGMLTRLAAEAGLAAEDVTREALAFFLIDETRKLPPSMRGLVRHLVYPATWPVVPTLVFLLRAGGRPPAA